MAAELLVVAEGAGAGHAGAGPGGRSSQQFVRDDGQVRPRPGRSRRRSGRRPGHA